MTDAPLTARSVLASALLGTDPPSLPVARLLRLGALFDLNENRVRVALSRMVAAGDLTTDGDGRYSLAGPLLERQGRQRASRTGTVADWDGTWTTVVLTSSRTAAAERASRRRLLQKARLGELRDGVWTRPANLAVVVPPGVGEHVVLTGTLDAEPSLWDLETWASDGRALLERLRRLPRSAEDLVPGFVLSASVLRHLQADPLLPPPLLPKRWPGTDLRDRYDAWDAAYRQVLATWHRST